MGRKAGEGVNDQAPDVETYPVPTKLGSGDPYLDQVWAAAARAVNEDAEDDAS